MAQKRLYVVGGRYDYWAIDLCDPERKLPIGDPVDRFRTRKQAEKLCTALNEAYHAGLEDSKDQQGRYLIFGETHESDANMINLEFVPSAEGPEDAYEQFKDGFLVHQRSRMTSCHVRIVSVVPIHRYYVEGEVGDENDENGE